MEKNVMLEDNLLFELETFIHITLLYMTVSNCSLQTNKNTVWKFDIPIISNDTKHNRIITVAVLLRYQNVHFLMCPNHL